MNSDRAYVPWVILGAGRMGQALAQLGSSIGVDIRAIWNRSPVDRIGRIPMFDGELFDVSHQLGGAIVWITVADDAIEEVAREAASYLGPADIVIHCSGSLDSSILRASGVQGPIASLHPLLAIADPRVAAEKFPHCVWTVEGDFPALAFARWALGRLGVTPVEIEADSKVLYHASAVTAAGLVDALMDVAFTIAESAGFSPEQSRAMLLPLAQSTLDNLRDTSTAKALTGPVARGDEATLQRHRVAMAQSLPDEYEVYALLTARAKSLLDRS